MHSAVKIINLELSANSYVGQLEKTSENHIIKSIRFDSRRTADLCERDTPE